MRVRLEAIQLTGTTREVRFQPGLNIITGPITTGKTSLLRMCRAVFGSSIDRFPREVRFAVSALSARILLGDDVYQVSRRFVSTSTALVDIAGPGEQTWRLPSSAPVPGVDQTYGQWLLRRLGLPVIRVPLAPTQAESTPSALSINDYFLYCTLTQNEIDNSVFGHHDYYKNNKRKYVFGILYGLYSAEIAHVQEEIREVVSRLTTANTERRAFESMLEGTPWENRAVLEQELRTKRELLLQAESDDQAPRDNVQSPPVRTLASEIVRIDRHVANVQNQARSETESIEELTRLARQLEFQVSKLTRSIVAGELFSDIEFVVCPRCGSRVTGERGPNGVCMLCLQNPTTRFDRSVLVEEQNRISKQIVETQELIATRRKNATTLQRELDSLLAQRQRASHELEVLSRSFVSDHASQIAASASRRAELQGDVRRVTEYLQLFTRLDNIRSAVTSLEQRRAELEAQIDLLSTRGEESETKIRSLESKFGELLARFNVPQFGEAGATRIDRETLLPVVHGRRFDELSSQGLKVLVNVAHALAHQVTSIELGLALPNILFIDGLTSNVSREDADLDRVIGIYEYLVDLSSRLGDDLQIIVADQDIPESGEPFVRLRLGENDRLIPSTDLERLRAEEPQQTREGELSTG